MDVIDTILKEIDFHLNGEMFRNKKPDLKNDRFYGMAMVITQTEALFLKNLLEDIKEDLCHQHQQNTNI